MTARFAAALSVHPLPTHAIGEAVGEVLERIGPEPDLAFVSVSGGHRGAIDDIVEVIHRILAPRSLLGATSVAVLAEGNEVEDEAGLVLWAAHLGGEVETVRLVGEDARRGWVPAGEDTVVVLADPFSFHTDGWLARVREVGEPALVVGGLASAARGPGGNRLVLDREIVTDGAVAVALSPAVEVAAVVSQGCRPVGAPFIATEVDDNVIVSLGGQPALTRLAELVDEADEADRERIAAGLHVGVVVDEGKVDFTRGDFLIRGVVGLDRDRGGVAIGDRIEVGTTVQFQVRDAQSADEDLRTALAGRRADGALMFTCNGRGRRLFSVEHHDAAALEQTAGAPAAAGMFCAGEIGPVGDLPFLHGFTASTLLFP